MASNKTKHKRGDIWLVDLDPQNRPDEIAKERPALIIQSDELNAYMNNTVILPFTTAIVDDSEPLRINYTLDFLKRNSDLVISQPKTISCSRLIRKLGTLPAAEMSKISQYFGIVLGIGR